MDCQKIKIMGWGGGGGGGGHGKEGMYMELSYCQCYFNLTWLVYHLDLLLHNK